MIATTTGCTTVEECGALADHYMDIAMVFWYISLGSALVGIILSIVFTFTRSDDED
jgi:hypothetical protein